METNIKTRIKKAFVLLLQPLVKLALRNGITYREFCDLSKGCFVKVAANEYGVNGRPTNNSRVALITGINRKDIKKVKDMMVEGSIDAQKAPDRIARVITGWQKDEKYSENGQSKVLNEMEFASLAEEYGGDIAAGTLLKELQRSEVVAPQGPDQYELCKSFYIPLPSTGDKASSLDYLKPEAMVHAGSIINDHVTTIYHNLYRDESKDQETPQRFERRATNLYIGKQYLPEFKGFSDALAQRFLEDIDEWLSAHEQPPESDQVVRLGMGAFWIQGDDASKDADL